MDKKRKKLPYYAAAGLVILMAYFAFTDRSTGEFSPPTAPDLAMWRIGEGFEAMVDTVATWVSDTNENMQDVADERMDYNDERIERAKEGS